MSLRPVIVILVVGILGLGLYAWLRTTQPATPEPPMAGSESGTPAQPQFSIESGGDPGITWMVPGRWKTEEGTPMRLATYGIPAAKGDDEDARCAVYYFGPGQGGTVADNIERWINEFDKPKPPERVSKKIGDLPVTTVRVRGTYLAHATMSGDSDTRPDYQLYGAIVEAPSGAVFFKLTGPGKTVDIASVEFQSLLESLKKK